MALSGPQPPSAIDDNGHQVLFAISNNAAMGISHHPFYPGFEETSKFSCLQNHPESRFSSIQRVMYGTANNSSGQLVAKLLSCEIFKNMSFLPPKRQIGCTVTYFDVPHDTDVFASGSFPVVSSNFCNRISNDFRQPENFTCYNNLNNIVSYVRRKASSSVAISDAVIFLSLSYEQQLEDLVHMSRYCRCFVMVVIGPDLTERSSNIWKKLEKLKSATLLPYLCTELKDIRKVGSRISHQIYTRKPVTEEAVSVELDSTRVELKFGSMPSCNVKIADNESRAMRISGLEVCGFLDTQQVDRDLKCISFDCQCIVEPVARTTGSSVNKKKFSRGRNLLSLLSHGLKENSQSALVEIRLEVSRKAVTSRHGLLFPCDDILQLAVFPDNGPSDRWRCLLKYKIGMKTEKKKVSPAITRKESNENYRWETPIQVSRSLLDFTRCARGVVSQAPKKLEATWKVLSTHCRVLAHQPSWLVVILEDFEKTTTDPEIRQLLTRYLQEVRSGLLAK